MTEFSCCKLEIFIPESHLPVLQQALREADAGHIGSYDSCLSYSPVTSCWRPLTGSEPYLGQVGALSTEPELKVEVTCRREKLDETLRAVKAVHLYEEPVINVTEVVAALIWQGERFMICQRPAHKARGMLWEFVGGKVEPGESKEQALVRECREELAVEVAVGDIFLEVTHTYPDITVHLTLFHASIVQGVPQKLEHNDIRYITVDEIPKYEFCPADEVILQKLRQEGGRS